MNVMKELRQAALTRAHAFYEFGVLGEPAVVFPFVMMLHTLKQDFKEDLDHANGMELLDWWDVLSALKAGLLLSAQSQAKQGLDVLQHLKQLYECGDFVISSLEEGVECEFQWLLCQQYTVRNKSLDEVWQRWASKQTTLHVSNEYTGENVLHVLIVQGGGAHVYIAKLFEMLTLQRYRMSLLSAEVRSRAMAAIVSRDHSHDVT